jgi:UDP-GlcNAc:undecaprenyl-phosphate/decaprenyl-phosphate GlcNAc-1-phosphate transferase
VQSIGPAVASFALCLLATFALRPFAVALNLIDRPGGHKTHHGEVPIVGGIAMLLGVTLGFGLLPLPEALTGTFLAGCALLVTIGLLDDRFSISPWARLPVHAAAALLMIFGTGAIVTSFGAPVAAAELTLDGGVAVAFTTLAIVMGINAFNMLDGMDGLAGAMALVALSGLAFIAYTAGAVVPASLSLVLAGAVAAFLISNVPLRFNQDVRCFMGDSGSTLLGFAVAWLCVVVSQPPAQVAAPVTVLWVVALPLFDIFWSVIRRLLRGESPMKPDHEHLHHLLLRAGFGVRGAFLVLVLLGLGLAATGAAFELLGVPDAWSFWLLIGAGIAVLRLMYRAELLWAFVPESLRRIEPVAPLPVAATRQ